MSFSFEKQPSEEPRFSVDFTKRLPSGETPNTSTSTVKAFDESNIDVSSTILGATTFSGNIIISRAKAGTSGKQYKIQFLCITTPGILKYEEDVFINVREV